MREALLPPVWAHLQGTLRYVQRVSDTEHSAACPDCGGTVHSDGSWPDRLRIFSDARPLTWCRRCGTMCFPDSDGSSNAPTAAEMERWRREQIAREEARKRSADLALQHLREDAVWLRYHRALDTWAREYWRGRGIPDEWQDRWCLGWNRHYAARSHDGILVDTPAATIPLFNHDGQALNVKMRLISPPDDAGKYRYLIRGQPHPMFLTDPAAPMDGHVVAVEGELKAAVTYIALQDDSATVVGLPGATPGQHVVEALATAERVTLVMDPGAEEQAAKLAIAVGTQRARVLILPGKIDDVILATGASPAMVRRWLAQAQRPKPQRRTA